MDFDQLSYFVATAECGNVTRAARRFRMAQPSLSHQIKKLEGFLGTPLFDRLGRGVALTDAGRALLPRARRILAEVHDAQQSVKREAAAGHGMLAVGAIPTMAPYLLPPALKQVQARWPRADMTIREDLTENLVDALVENQLDCILVSTPLRHELLDVEVLGEEMLLAVTPKSHPAVACGHMRLADFAGQAVVVLEEIHCLGRQIQGFCLTRRIAPRVVCRTTQLATVFDLVALGAGISLAPEMALAALGKSICRALPLKDAQLTRQVAIAWRTNRTRPPAATLFAETIRQNLSTGRHAIAGRT